MVVGALLRPLCALLIVVSLASPRAASAQDVFGWEAALGVAIPSGGTSSGRRAGPAGHLALRLARPSSHLTYGVLADVGYMPGKTFAAGSSGDPVGQSPLRVSTIASTAHLESPTATRGLFAELGAGVSWLTLTQYRVSSTTPMLLAGAGAFAPLRRFPLRLGLQYQLYFSDLGGGGDLDLTRSLRISLGVGRR